ILGETLFLDVLANLPRDLIAMLFFLARLKFQLHSYFYLGYWPGIFLTGSSDTFSDLSSTGLSQVPTISYSSAANLFNGSCRIFCATNAAAATAGPPISAASETLSLT